MPELTIEDATNELVSKVQMHYPRLLALVNIETFRKELMDEFHGARFYKCKDPGLNRAIEMIVDLHEHGALI